jgi:hypothetical protein
MQYQYCVYCCASNAYYLLRMHSARIHHTIYPNVLVLGACTLQYYYYAYCSTCTEYHVILVASLRGGIRFLRERQLQWQQPACFIWFIKTKVARDRCFLTIACASSAHALTSSTSICNPVLLLCILWYEYWVPSSTSAKYFLKLVLCVGHIGFLAREVLSFSICHAGVRELKKSEVEKNQLKSCQGLSSFPYCKDKTACYSARVHYNIWKHVLRIASLLVTCTM